LKNERSSPSTPFESALTSVVVPVCRSRT
jgi:hypothetical protein